MIFKLLLRFWTAQAWPRRTFGYFGLRRRGPDALSADNSFPGSRYYAGESSDFDVFYFLCFCDFLRRRFGLRRRGPNTHFSENCNELLVFGRAFLDKAFGSAKYPNKKILLRFSRMAGLTAAIAAIALLQLLQPLQPLQLLPLLQQLQL